MTLDVLEFSCIYCVCITAINRHIIASQQWMWCT